MFGDMAFQNLSPSRVIYFDIFANISLDNHLEAELFLSTQVKCGIQGALEIEQTTRHCYVPTSTFPVYN